MNLRKYIFLTISIIALLAYIAYNNGENEIQKHATQKKQNMELISMDNYSEQDKAIEALYAKIPSSQLEDLETTTDKELVESVQDLAEKYDVGEPFNTKDRNLFVYTYEKKNPTIDMNEKILPTVWAWNNYDVKNEKTLGSVKVGYKGTLSSYARLSGGSYKSHIRVTLYSGKKHLKHMKWTTHHTSYGLLGTSGKTPSVGIIYNGSSSSSNWTNSFTYSKTTNFSSLVPLYTKTWGTLNVNTTTGNYNMNTKTYQRWE